MPDGRMRWMASVNEAKPSVNDVPRENIRTELKSVSCRLDCIPVRMTLLEVLSRRFNTGAACPDTYVGDNYTYRAVWFGRGCK